jgi:hypothetical protein
MRKDHRGPSSRISGLGVLVIIALGVAIGVIGLNFKRWELGTPEVTFDREFATVGKNPALNLSVADAGSGLSHVTVRIKQKEGEIALVDEALNNEPSKSYDLGKLLVENAKLTEGPATLTVTAADHGLLRFFQANRAEVTKEFKLDTTPPTLEVFSGQHYINQGGSDGVVYRVSEDVEVSGVQAGPYFFPGFPVSKSDPKMRFALFALAYNLPADTKIQVVARDGAANEAKAGILAEGVSTQAPRAGYSDRRQLPGQGDSRNPVTLENRQRQWRAGKDLRGYQQQPAQRESREDRGACESITRRISVEWRLRATEQLAGRVVLCRPKKLYVPGEEGR